MQDILNQFAEIGRNYLFGLIAPLAILVVGWLAALSLSSLLRRVLKRLRVDERFGRWTGAEASPPAVSRWMSRVLFYLLMLLVLVAFFQSVGLTLITQPLNQMLGHVFSFAPRLLSAAFLLLIAWALASFLRFVIGRGLGRLRFDERLGESAELERQEGASVSENIATAVYWLVYLLFLPALLSTLEVQGLIMPVGDMLAEVTGFLPNLLAAGLVLLVGWFTARIVQRIVSSLLATTGLDRIGDGSVLAEQSLSALIGRVAYILILIPAAIVALDALELRAVSEPASQMLTTALEVLPAVFTAALLILIAYLAGRLISGLAAELLDRVGFNRLLQSLGLAGQLDEGGTVPSTVVGHLVFVGVLLFAVIEAADLVGFATLAQLLTHILTFAGHVLLALVVFGLGLYLARLLSSMLANRGGRHANLMASVVRVAVIGLATAMALRQMGVANEIITMGFSLLLGAVAVAVALAFGLGARDIAAREVERWLRERQAGRDGAGKGA